MNNKFTPSVAEIERCKKAWEKDDYFLAEKVLRLTFQGDGKHLRLTDADLLAQTALLNALYRVNIFDIYSVSEHYKAVAKNGGMEKRLKEGDLSLVEDLSMVTTRNGKVRHCYSFATKFCSFHNPEKFPIYDSVVSDMLYNLNKKDGFSKFSKTDLKDYSKYVGVIRDFQKKYNLTEASFWEIDKMLWINGKKK